MKIRNKFIFSILLIFIFTIFNNNFLFSQKTISLDGSENERFIDKEIFLYYEDSESMESIQSILDKDGLSKKFSQNLNSDVFFIENPNSTYWIKLKIKNNSGSLQHYTVESFNYRLDTLIFYETQQAIVLNSDSAGISYFFNKREMLHKNLVYSFWINSSEEKTIYIKIKNRYFTPVEVVLRKLTYFTSYAISEYFFLGLFYGSILILILLNIMAAAFLKSLSHVYYSFYLFFVGTFFMSQDGLGFQYLWPNQPFINDYGYMLSVYFIIVFLLLYTGHFLNLKLYYPTLLKGFYIFILFRTVLLIINLIFFPNIRHFLYIDLLPFMSAYYCAYLSYRSGYPLSKYFLVGFTILVVGVMSNFLRFTGLVDSNVYTFYFINICFLLEMIIFYFALAERIRYYKQNSKASAGLKRMIDDKENTIKQFTYKTSHDISGPVKTILGLTNVALTNNDTDKESYLKMIQETALRLDDIVSILSEINHIQAHLVEKTPLDISIIIEKVLTSPKIKEHTKNINCIIKRESTEILYSDSYLLYTTLVNLLLYQLNCIQYEKPKSVYIIITITNSHFHIYTSNTGKIISEEYHKNLYDIFFRLSNDSADFGTNMQMVKICLEKVGGNINIKNLADSTSFELTIPL